jgi:aerobic carbon-monoxide dehydrogenase large subunit
MPISKGLGARVQRLEDDRLLTGRTEYLDSVSFPDMLHVAFLRSSDAHADLLSVDVSEALEIEGVETILSAEEANALCKPLKTPRASFEPIITHQSPSYPVMADKRIRFVGEILAAVVAKDRYVAEDAVEVIYAETEPREALSSIDKALAEGAEVLHAGLNDNRFYHGDMPVGDVEGIFSRADHIVEGSYKTNRICASPMENRAVVATVDAVTGRLTVWTSTQVPHMVRTVLAELLEMPEGNIRVIAPDVGGGFGLKCHVFPEELIIAALAWKLKRPVKWQEDRRENYTASYHAQEEQVDVSIAVSAEGQLQAIKTKFVSDGGAYTAYPFTPGAEPSMAAAGSANGYKFQALHAVGTAVITNKSTSSVCRGVGFPISVFGIEHTIDKVASVLGMDPVELRRRNLLARADFPYQTPIGTTYDSGSLLETLEQAVELIDYDAFREEQAEARKDGRYLGIGFAPFMELTGYGKDSLSGAGIDNLVSTHDSARIKVDPDGSISVYVGTLSHGQGHATTYAQLVSEVLKVPYEVVRVFDGDTDSAPVGSGTWGSRSAVAGGGAVLQASKKVLEKCRLMAGHLLQADPADVEVTDGGDYRVAGGSGGTVSFQTIARAAVYENNVPDGFEPTLDSRSAYPSPSPYTNATHVAVVEVDVATGQVDILRYAVSEDCGTMINPMVIDGQIIGGVVQGIGAACLEDIQYDEYGQLLTGSMMDYLLPTAPEVPEFALGHMETPSPKSEAGIKGMGEGGAIGPRAAVSNAVSDALIPLIGWQEMTQLPITPQRIFDLLKEGRRND